MKKLQTLFWGILLILSLLIIAIQRIHYVQGVSSQNTLTIYNWGDYIDPALLKKFESETGYKVVYETFDSNEAMFTKLQQGGTNYDLTIPSEYMIQKMISEDMLLPLDHRNIKGLDAIDPRFLNLSFDLNNQYSIPYFWGTLGIVYNDKMVDHGTIKTWNDLWQKELENNLMLIDGAREVMGLALNSEGWSLNSKDMDQLKIAEKKLTKLTPNVKAIVADEMKMYMIQEESAACVTFSGEAVDMLEENEHLHYVIPEEGSNLWFDNMVIPKTAKNIEGAYAFINFMLRPENAAQNAEYIGYSTPNKEAMALLPTSITEDPQFYPDAQVMQHLEVYEDLGQYYLELYNDLFLQFKMFPR